MSQIAFAFNSEELDAMLSGPAVFTKVVMSLCNLRNPTSKKTMMHIVAHFTKDDGTPFDKKVRSIACPFPPGWDPKDHDGSKPPPGVYQVDFDLLKGSPKFAIGRSELLAIVKANRFPKGAPGQPQQLLATIEATNGTQDLETFINFIPDPGEILKMAGKSINVKATAFSPLV